MVAAAAEEAEGEDDEGGEYEMGNYNADYHLNGNGGQVYCEVGDNSNGGSVRVKYDGQECVYVIPQYVGARSHNRRHANNPQQFRMF